MNELTNKCVMLASKIDANFSPVIISTYILHPLFARSDNALGSILLNIMVDTARIDMVGDNNILLATVPNPPIPGLYILIGAFP